MHTGILLRTDNFQIVDFAIWLLFQKSRTPTGRVQHLLCQGFRKNVNSRTIHKDGHVTAAIPGVLSVHPNDHVAAMKSSPWTEVLALMGQEGERVMIDLILDCGVYVCIDAGSGIYHQLNG